jgi:hypothetical protein
MGKGLSAGVKTRLSRSGRWIKAGREVKDLNVLEELIDARPIGEEAE